MKPEARVKEIQREMLKVSIIDTPGSILVGLGVYAKFAANGDAFHPLLNDESVVNLMLAVGTTIMIWGVYKIITLSRERKHIIDEHGL